MKLAGYLALILKLPGYLTKYLAGYHICARIYGRIVGISHIFNSNRMLTLISGRISNIRISAPSLVSVSGIWYLASVCRFFMLFLVSQSRTQLLLLGKNLFN